MTCTIVNSQAQVQSRLPSLPQTLPKTQADWNAVLATFNQWGSILQQASHAPNVIPSQFQTFTVSAATAVIAALSAVNCTPSVDTGQQYYGAASLKVAISASGATLAFAGNPISIAPASRWFASFQIYAPGGCTGQLTVKTSAGHSVSESFTVTALAEWQQVWGLVDLRQYADTQASWQFTFTSTATVWLDGMQMNAVGSPIGVLPKFAGTQMVTGALAYQSNLDGVPDGSTFVRLLASNAAGNAAYNFKGIWNSATTYAIADEVVYGLTYWLAISASTNSAPPSGNWQAVGSYGAFLGAWSSITAYAIGSEVTYTGNFWICVTANTNSAPTTSNPNWQIAGPTSLDAVPDGTSRFAGIQAAASADGFQILSNPDFAGGSLTGYSVYDLNSSGKVSITAVADATAPNSSGYKMEVQTAAGTPVPAPDLGGFFVSIGPDSGAYAVNTYHKGSTIIWRIRANIPVGFTLQFNTNSFGSDGTFEWITPQNGTGGWFDYVAKQVIGTIGTFSTTGFFSMAGTAPVAWYVAACSAACVSFPQGVGIPPANVDANRRALIDFVQAGHLGKVLDNIGDGTNYSRTLAAWVASGVPYNYQGAWSSVTSYVKGAEVSSGGNYYLAIAASTNQPPPNGTYWQLLGPTSLDNLPDGTTYQRGQRYAFGNNTAAAQWMHVGTLILNGASSATLRWHTGQGYNTGNNQQAICEITIRAANNAAAPNISGISVIIHGSTQPLTAFKAAATGGSAAVNNVSWELYADCASFTFGPLEVTVNSQASDSFAFSGVAGADPGIASTTVAVGFVGKYLDPTQGSGLDGLGEGTNYLRMPAPPSASASLTGGTLTQTGTGAQFTVSACTYYLGNLTMSVNAGTVNPGSYNTFYVYFDSPNYAGGTIPFQVTTDPTVLGQYPWRFYVGKITTSPTGGGGGGGGGGPCFTGDVGVKTAAGYQRFDELPEEFEIVNLTGRHRARLIVHPKSIEPMRRMGDGLVTAGHLILVGDGWVPAGQIFHEKAPTTPRTVYNMHVLSDSPEDHHYLLENGLTAHNIKP